MASRSWEKAHSPYWSLHVEAWRQSRMDRAIYCRQHGLSVKTFGRWMNHLISKEEARKHAEYLLELRREERRQERRKKGKRRQKRRYAVSTDIRSRAIQAFWAIHVEAMNWNGMGVREYAASFQLSPTSPREWRDRFENTEVEDGAGGKDRVGCDGGEVSEEACSLGRGLAGLAAAWRGRRSREAPAIRARCRAGVWRSNEAKAAAGGDAFIRLDRVRPLGRRYGHLFRGPCRDRRHYGVYLQQKMMLAKARRAEPAGHH